jgi:teichuronic acid biosynthesis glycosyltransferase TuaC
MRILSLTSIFPNPSEPGLGPFVEARLQALGRRATVQVITPIAPFDRDNPNRRGLRRTVPFRRVIGSLEVFAPAWLYPPGDGFLKGPLLAIQVAPLVAWIKNRGEIDLIDAHFANPEGVAAALLAGAFRRPFTVTLRGTEPRHSRRRLRRWLMGWALKHANVVFAVSDQLAELSIELGASPGSVRVVMNGVDVNDFGPPLVEEPPPRREYSEVLSVGRLVISKGHQRVIRAVASLVQRGVRVQLRILGEAGRGGRSYEAELRELVKSFSLDGQIQFGGWVPRAEVLSAMMRADVVCLASEREGCPNVVCEALACGTPVVAHDVGTVRRQVVDERFGFVVPVGNEAALEEALERALNRRWDRSAIAARGRARTWDNVADELFSVYESVVPAASAALREGTAETKAR